MQQVEGFHVPIVSYSESRLHVLAREGPSIRQMQSQESFQTCNFILTLTIMSVIIITCLNWMSFSLVKLKDFTGKQRRGEKREKKPKN